MDSKTLCEQLARASGCEVRGDDLTRALYATDASIYQVLPKGVAFPRTSADVAGLVRAAGEAGVSLVARGAGSGLAGGAVGEGIVVDFSRHMNRIIGFDRDRGEIRVEPGVVLDTLNTYLRPFGLQFGPDVATSSRATLGGMIGNNSSGARASVYGATSEHVLSLEVVDSWGEVTETHSPPARDLPIAGALKRAESLVTSVADLVRQRFHDRIPKRWPGYGFDRVLREMARQQRLDPAMLITGSEGTLGLVTAATLRVVPLPREKGLVVLFFPTVRDALEASVRLLPLRPAAIEHIDHVLFDQIRGQSVFATARAFLELDEKPHASILMVEFEEDAADRARDALRAVPEGRGKVCGPEDAARVWALRKAGLSLLTGCPGPAKPTAGIEDVCVPPERLAEYAAALGGILDREGLRASFYGHAGSGLLHVRPVVDLH
ncbi:MAG TPA: FAD-binding oxidoreductase, partial [Candidatus Hydrogenedentes bacterium]|nr:FAD-binding oxidoreductase [Candidatus Hydrogenedentota bacterium]